MLCDGQVVDAREATLHQALRVELPILVAIARVSNTADPSALSLSCSLRKAASV
jgi:hypothetical protein